MLVANPKASLGLKTPLGSSDKASGHVDWDLPLPSQVGAAGGQWGSSCPSGFPCLMLFFCLSARERFIPFALLEAMKGLVAINEPR